MKINRGTSILHQLKSRHSVRKYHPSPVTQRSTLESPCITSRLESAAKTSSGLTPRYNYLRNVLNDMDAQIVRPTIQNFKKNYYLCRKYEYESH